MEVQSIVILVVALAVVIGLYIARPQLMYGILSKFIIKVLRENEGLMVQSIYNKMPDEVKVTLGSEAIAEVVSEVVEVTVEVIEGKEAK